MEKMLLVGPTSISCLLLRVVWRSVSDIVTRVVAARAGQLNRVAAPDQIDEISYR